MCRFQQLINELDEIIVKEKNSSIEEVNEYLNKREKDIIRLVPILDNITDIKEAKNYTISRFNNINNIKLLGNVFQKDKSNNEEYKNLINFINKKYNSIEVNILLKLDELIFKI